MYKRIVLNNSLSFKERLKNLVRYYRMRRSARIQWKKAFDRVLSINPQHNYPLDKSIEKAHREYWKPFKRRINLSTFRISSRISGIVDRKYVPEEIFLTDLEQILNPTPAVRYFSYKSLLSSWFSGNIFPRDYFHNIDGKYFDNNLDPISINKVDEIAGTISYPVVMKPNRDSYGGENIYFPANKPELLQLLENNQDFLVQEKIMNHSFYRQFNDHGINTLRVNLYRSFKTNEWHIITITLRMGVAGSLDNLHSGGIAVGVNKFGYLNGYGIDRYASIYDKHPDNEVTFDKQIPDFEGLRKFALGIANKVFYARIIALDVCYDSESCWRAIEVNINDTTISFLGQYHGTTLFGDFTDEVHEYCLKNHWALGSAKH